MDYTSFGLSLCMPPIEDNRAPPVEIGQAPPIMTNQAASVQTNLAPPLTTNRVPAVQSNLASTPVSIPPTLPFLTNEAPSISASLGQTPVSTIQIPHISSNQASTIPANLASARVSIVHTADDLSRLGAHFSHIWNRQNHDIPNIPSLNYQHLLTTDTLGMPPPFSSTVAPSTSAIQPTHLHTGRSQSVTRNWTPPVQTASPLGRTPGSQRAFNSSYTLRSPSPHVHHLQPYISMSRPRAPPVQTASLLGRAPGSQHAFNSSYTLQSPSPHVHHLRPYIAMSRPRAPPAPMPDSSYNAP